MNITHAPSAARTWRNLATVLLLGTMVTAAFADIDYIERSGKDWIATPRVPGDFTSIAPSVNTPARIFTANASGGVEGRDLPGLAVAFRSAAGHYIDLAVRKNGGAKNNDLYAVSSEGAVALALLSRSGSVRDRRIGDL